MTKRTVVAVAVVVTLLLTAGRPSPAHAVSTAVLVVGSIVAFAGFVVAGTLLTTHRQGASSLQEGPDEGPHAPAQMPEGAVRWGAHCRPTADGQPLVCW
jgi:hypothetical protein